MQQKQGNFVSIIQKRSAGMRTASYNVGVVSKLAKMRTVSYNVDVASIVVHLQSKCTAQ